MSLLILVVDDDPAIRLLVSCSLKQWGYSAIAAENGKEAQKQIEECQPHLVITDISMPEMDGYELIEWIRQHPTFRLLPVMFLTARTDTEGRIRGYQVGGDAYLAKPFELNELYAVVRNLLERSQLISQLMQWEWRLRLQQQNVEQQQGKTYNTIHYPSSQEEPTIRVDTPRYNPYQHQQERTTDTKTFDNFSLTKREQAVLQLLVKGLSNSQIGSSLYLSPRTVEKYVSNLLCKTGTNNRVELACFARERHLINS
jgi:DNA-binding NarL/FixJ family response regulator